MVAAVLGWSASAVQPPTAQASAKAKLKPLGFEPLTSKEAAERVRRTGYEPRPKNGAENRTAPRRRQLREWHSGEFSPYSELVNGRFRGTTDEVIQWAAYKWGLPEDLLRAAAVVESWWDMDAVGDNGDSFGLFQIRRPYHCDGECAIARDSTAFNADYYGAVIRAYFEGEMEWLNTVEHGKEYKPGDLWGSVGAWFSGRWWTQPSVEYVGKVRQALRDRTWREPDFISYGS